MSINLKSFKNDINEVRLKKSIVKASEWNEIFNLLALQANNLYRDIKDLYTGDGEQSIHLDMLPSIPINKIISIKRVAKAITLVAFTDEAPVSASDRDVYYNTTAKKLYTWDDDEGEDGDWVDERDPESGSFYGYDDVVYLWDGTNLIDITKVDISGKLDKDFSGFDEKETPHDDDLLVINDSEDSGTKKKLKIQNLPTDTQPLDDAEDINYDNEESGLTATNVQAAIDEVDGKFVDLVNYYTTIISTEEWSGSEPTTAVKTVNGLLETDVPIIDTDLSGVTFGDIEEVQTQYSNIYRVAITADNEITFYATQGLSEDLTINIKVVR